RAGAGSRSLMADRNIDSNPTIGSGQAKRSPREWTAIALAALGLMAALARVPLIRTPVDVSPDGCEYLGIARHLAEEGRWVSSLKWHFFTDSPVVHPAIADRPPLY